MNLTKEQQRNCLKLADILEQHVSDKQFDMGTYGRADNVCGTVGCALGWGAMSGMIPNLGYCASYVNDNGEDIYVTSVKEMDQDAGFDLQPIWFQDGKAHQVEWEEAGCHFFGDDVQTYLFSAGRQQSRSRVAARLRNYANAR